MALDYSNVEMTNAGNTRMAIPLDPNLRKSAQKQSLDVGVDEYMGQQVTDPLMPAQGQYIPQSQQIQPGEEISPEAYALQGTPEVPISQAQTALAAAPTISPAATVEIQL
jgi:hypothetical protein